jgi:glycosyltransferase involved in cell wall biosynthesis
MTNRLRILHITDYFHPILGYQETFLAKAQSRNNDTLVITSDRYAKMIYVPNKNLLKKRVIGPGYFVERGIKVLRLPTLFEKIAFNHPWLMGLEQCIVNFKPNLIIVHGVVSITSIRIARLKSKLPLTRLIFDDHMTKNATRGGWINLIYKIFKRFFTPLLLKAADGFVAAVSYETKRFMEEIYGIPSIRITTIPLGVDRNIFQRDLETRNKIRKKYAIEDDELVFIYTGKIMPEKGSQLLINAGIRLCKNHSNIKIMLVGGSNTAYLEKLRERIRKSDLGGEFIFIEAVPNEKLCKFYNAADVGIWPLQCSISMIEAMACGLPIIISDKSGTTERVSEGTGILYREGDSKDLEAKMEIMLNEERRKIMSKNAEEYTKKLDWDFISKRFLYANYPSKN